MLNKLLKPTLTSRERADFYSRLESLTEAGITLPKALDRVAGRQGSRIHEMLGGLRQDVRAGVQLHEAMQALDQHFSAFEVGLTRAGEEGGTLPEMLLKLARYFERKDSLVQLAKEAIAPPVIALVLAIVFFSIPNFMLQGLFAYLYATVTPLAFGIGLVAGWQQLSFRTTSSSSLRAVADRVSLSLPILGSTTRDVSLANYCEALAGLWGAGVPAIRSLELAANASGNVALERKLTKAARNVERGDSLEQALYATGALTPDLLDAVAVGEETGKLDEGLEKMAESIRKRAESRLRTTLPSALRMALVPVVVFFVFYKVFTIVPLLVSEGTSYMDDRVLEPFNRVMDRVLN